ncbi:MAG: hypothetical protein ACK4KW_07755 [Gemmobacter sp.]
MTNPHFSRLARDALAINRRVKHHLRHFRYGLRRLKVRIAGDPEEPPLVETVDDALARLERGEVAQFMVPLADCRLKTAQSFGRSGWNPFSELVRELIAAPDLVYRDSILARYYHAWRPRNGAESVAGLETSCRGLVAFPAWAIQISPWDSRDLDAGLRRAQVSFERDMSQNGEPGITLQKDGFYRFGPVSDRLGEVEFARFRKTLGQIRNRGYNRAAGLELGDPGVLVDVLERGTERCFVNRNGLHRMAVMDALGHDYMPVRLYRRRLIRREDADDWPNVKRGLWSKAEALRYFDHLFEFDARSWARGLGLMSRGAADRSAPEARLSGAASPWQDGSQAAG